MCVIKSDLVVSRLAMQALPTLQLGMQSFSCSSTHPGIVSHPIHHVAQLLWQGERFYIHWHWATCSLL